MRPARTFAPLLLTVALVACGGEEQQPPAGSSGPALSTRIEAGESISPGDKFSVGVEVSGFELDPDAIGGENAEGRGHYHVYWDDVEAEPAAVAAGAQTEVTVPAGAVDGTHRIIVSLRNNDHSALDPAVQAAAEVTVSGGTASPAVSWTADNVTALQTGDTITLDIQVENFTLDDAAMGGENAPGVGHYHVYWDDASGEDYLVMGAAPTVRIQVPDDATDGSHRITVSLRNNDHSPLSPQVEAEDWVLVYRLD